MSEQIRKAMREASAAHQEYQKVLGALGRTVGRGMRAGVRTAVERENVSKLVAMGMNRTNAEDLVARAWQQGDRGARNEIRRILGRDVDFDVGRAPFRLRITDR